jgi:REP element-mobilizing transposase RayT
VQQLLFKQRGGKRKGAGRPPKGYRAGSPHKPREVLHERFPVHVTLRVTREIGSLRKKAMYHAIRQATLTSAASGRIRIVHISVQRTHLHLLVEAKNKKLLAAGLQGFQVSAAKHLNTAFGKVTKGPRRQGAVFVDRYHAEIVRSPTQMRHTMAYILLNFRRHREDQVAPMSQWKVDWFSSAAMFPHWSEYDDEAFLWRGPATYEPLWVWRPQTWLASEGWRKVSPTISCREVPSSGR